MSLIMTKTLDAPLGQNPEQNEKNLKFLKLTSLIDKI